MKRFLDSSVLVEACLQDSPCFESADQLIHNPDACTSAHALAECYATLSGNPRLHIRPADAAQMVADIDRILKVQATSIEDYRKVITEAPDKGVRGGLIYDALQAQTARHAQCQEIRTLNVNHFKCVAPDLVVASLDKSDPS